MKSRSKIILLTGTSSGFGLLISARLASKGHTVIATMRNLSKKEDLLNEVKKRGGTVDIQRLDVTQKETIQKTVDYIKRTYGKLDVLINNAGFGIGGFFEDLTDEDIRAQMETNFFGVLNVTREVLPLMREQRSGRIINISSIAGLYATPCFSAYNTSKWALEAFSESLKYEAGLFGIDVILVEPGSYRTKIFEENVRLAKDFDNPQSPYYDYSQSIKSMLGDYVASLKNDPEDIAKLVERLINAKHPAFRNLPDAKSKALALLRRFLPFSVFSGVIRAVLVKRIKDFPSPAKFVGGG